LGKGWLIGPKLMISDQQKKGMTQHLQIFVLKFYSKTKVDTVECTKQILRLMQVGIPIS